MRTMLPLKLTLLAAWAISARCTFTTEEVQVILSGLHKLKIRECIFTSETPTGNAVKTLNLHFIQTTFMKEASLKEYLRRTNPPNALTAIVAKTQIPELLLEFYERMHWFTWFLITNDDLDEKIRIPFNCQFFLVQKGLNGVYRLVESYHIKHSPIFSNEFAVWTPGNGLNATPLNFYGRRMDMKGVEMVRSDMGVHGRCNKYTLEREIQKRWVDSARLLNFSLKVLETPLSEELGIDTPDASSCIWGITSLERMNEWVFLNFGLSVRLVTKFRSSNEIGWRAYVKPLKPEMWAAVGLWLFLSTAAIIIVNGRTMLTFHCDIFTSFYCLCNSDPTATHPSEEPTSLSIKLVYLMTLLVPAVLIPAYSAYILSTLSIVSPLEPFHDLQSLIEHGKFKVTAVHNSFIFRYLQQNSDPEIQYMKDHLFVGKDNVAPSFSDLFDSICDDAGLVGLFVDTKYFRSLFKCRMYVAEQTVMFISTGFLFQKGSPLRRLFNELFAMYDERGLLYKPGIIRQGGPPRGENDQEKYENLNSLDMSQMSALFLLIPLGALLSGIVLVFERKFQEEPGGWHRKVFFVRSLDDDTIKFTEEPSLFLYIVKR